MQQRDKQRYETKLLHKMKQCSFLSTGNKKHRNTHERRDVIGKYCDATIPRHQVRQMTKKARLFNK
jgi:hypothetical protein